MNRKSFIQNSAAGLATITALSSVVSQEHTHDMKDMKDMKMPEPGKYSKAMMSAMHCQLQAQVCLSHCITEMGKGDKTLAACANSTREVIAACEAFGKIAVFDSPYTKKMAQLCEEVCKSCATECKKHSTHHKVCKDCMESCLSCAKEMAKLS